MRSAGLLLDHGELEDAVSRAYYAMFHAARAILFSGGLVAKTHRGTISAFGERVVKRGLLGEEYADMLRRAFDLRQRSDYELYAELGEELARQTLKDAERFVEKARELLSAGASAQPGRGLQYSGARNPEPLRDRRSTTQNLPYS